LVNWVPKSTSVEERLTAATWEKPVSLISWLAIFQKLAAGVSDVVEAVKEKVRVHVLLAGTMWEVQVVAVSAKV